MSDPTSEPAAAPLAAPPPGLPVPQSKDGVTLDGLAKSVRRLRIWLIVLTAILTLAIMGVVSSVALFAFSFGSMSGDLQGTNEEQVDQTRRQIEDTYGDRLQDVDVRAVEVDYGDAVPFPFSAISGNEMESLYIEYRIKDSGVVVADVMSSGMYEDITALGMLPTKGSLTSRMTQEQFERLLEAYGAETTEPLATVWRYGDAPFAEEMGQSIPDEVSVGDETYPARQLWTATQGRIVEGDSVDMNDETAYSRTALIFREDPETGEFVFLGTEPSSVMW